MDEVNSVKTVLITGAAGGLGKAFAAECAARGWNLILVDVNHEALPLLQAGMNRLSGIRADAMACDLTDATSREALWQQVRKNYSRLHGLINVAGVEFEGPFRERGEEDIRTMLRLNIEATVENTRQGLQLMPAGEHAFIINVSSLAAIFPMPIKAVYAASKRFLLHFTVALHHELKADQIHALALCPAGLPTHRASLQRLQSQGMIGQLTTLNVGTVAHKTIVHTLAGRSRYIPGPISQLIASLASFVPMDVAATFIQRRFRRALEARQRLGLVENPSSYTAHE